MPTPVALTPVAAPGSYAAAGVVLALAASDSSNGNKAVMTGNDLLIAFNSDTAPHTVTIASVADEFGRLGDITAESIATLAYHIFGPFKKLGWANGGNLLVTTSDVTVKLAVIQIP